MAKHHVVFGLGFGDEGKGTIVDYLAHRERPAFVVRFNGGAQAAHNVVLSDGRHHTFAQYGSGAFAGAATFLSRFMLVNPLAMERERVTLVASGAPGMGMFIDARALVTTPYHIHLNRQREASDRHGSCGMGIGETVRLAQEGLALTVGDIQSGDFEHLLRALWKATANADLPSPEALTKIYDAWVRHVCVTDTGWLKRLAAGGVNLLFEGAQGVLLDEALGWEPHHTWSNCTPDNALTLLYEAGVARADIEVIGVMRSYATRHGAGPFPTEVTAPLAHEAHNGQHPWQGEFRTGYFDARLMRYALACTSPDSIAVTHLDAIPEGGGWRWCDEYADDRGLKPRLAGARPIMKSATITGSKPYIQRIAEAVADALRVGPAKISIGSVGATRADKLGSPLC